MAISVDVIVDHDFQVKLHKAAVRYRSKSKHRKLLRRGAEVMREGYRDTVKAEPFTGEPKYPPTGNLARSIRTFSFTRSRKYHIGARVGGFTGTRGKGSKMRQYMQRKNSTKRTADGWYFGFQDKGAKLPKNRGTIRPRMMVAKAVQRHGRRAKQVAIKAMYEDLKYLLK